MKIVITGGYGFIGSTFVRLIRKEFPNCTILVIDKNTYCADPSNLEDIEHSVLIKDINDVVSSDLEFANYIVNFAAESHVDNSIANADPFIQTNINGTYALLKMMHKTCPGARFVQISTDEVYGSVGEEATEKSLLNPTSPYSASKAAADHIVMSYNKTFGLDTVITRSSNNYGPAQYKEKLIPSAICNLLVNKPAVIYGRGEEKRDWIHVDDNCKGILFAMLAGKSGEIYNLGSDKHSVRNVDIIKNIIKCIYPNDNPFTRINFIKDPRPGHDFQYSLCVDKAVKELSWSPSWNLLEGIKDTVEWYKCKYGK